MSRFLTIALLSLVLFVVAPQLLDAQIPNPGFESWTVAVPPYVPSMPVGWITSYYNITRSSAAHTGSAAVQGVTQDIGGGTIVPGSIQSLFGTNQRSAKLQGYYQLTAVGNDELNVVVIMYKSKMPIASGDSTFVGTGTGYVQFSVNVVYFSAEVPDSAQIIITSNGPSGSDYHAGTTFLVDDLSLSGIANSVQTVSTAPAVFSLEQNYPNPFNPSTTIRFSISSESAVQLSIYNLIGQEVARPVDEQKAPGVYAVRFDASSLPTGTYIYRLRAGNYSTVRTMTLIR
jgi:hypothetical protein